MAIEVLDPRVRDQIAAGEVVERPSSVVKELIENALDAGASRVSVELGAGGRRLVRVVDDGCGMSREDLELCVERFATSKLRGAEELTSIATLGFRGEALPSVASVSRLAVTSRPRGADSAWSLRVEGGDRAGAEPSGGAPGTAVEVRDLFFNVPARQKFMKSPRTELNRSLAAVSALALARPDVAFSVEHDGRTLLELAGAERLADRVAGLYAPDLVERLVEAEAQLGSGARLVGLVGLPTEHRGNGSEIHVFVGGRPVRDRTVSAAVNAAYSGLLPLRRYPVVFLFLEFPPGDVDVNVHPTKAEVRFARPGELFTMMERAVRGALSRAELAAAGGPADYGRAEPPDVPAAAEPRADFRAPRRRPAVSRPGFTKPRPRGKGPRQETLDLWTGSGSRVPSSGGRAGSELLADPEPGTRNAEPASSSPPADSSWRYVGQALDGYLLVENCDGLLVIDQHALHERLIYEELRAARAGSAAPSQGLLVPVTVETGRRHAEVLREARGDLLELGFDVEEFGGQSFLVRAVPAAVELSDLAGYLVELAEELAEGDARDAARSAEARRERVLAAVACKAAVKAGDRLRPQAAEDLVRRGLAPRPSGPLHTCPHGRPTGFLVDRAELAKRVGRT
jgi:DNA mismatch repair protein MutL